MNPYEPPSITDDAAVRDPTHQRRGFTRAQRWGTIAIVALVINIALAFSGLVFNARIFAAYTGIAVADYMDDDWAGVQLDHVRTTFILVYVCRLLTAAVLITWMYRCHQNLTALGHATLDSKPIWVVVCWFVPIMNLFCPYQVMQEIWWRSDPNATDAEPDRSTPLVTSWWLTWLAAIALATWGNRLDQHRDTASDMAWTAGIYLLHFFATIAAAFLLISIIAKVNRRQIERFLALEAAPSST